METSPEIKQKSVAELIQGVASMFESHKITETNRKLRHLVEISAREVDSVADEGLLGHSVTAYRGDD